METAFLGAIKALRGIRCDSDYPAARLTSFRIGGNIRYVIYPENTEILCDLLRILMMVPLPFRVIGFGSNILASDEEYPGAWVMTRHCRNLRFFGTRLEADAGVSLHTLIDRAAERGLGGLENLYGIPGSLGGAVVMNAGAYGVSVADAVTTVLVWDLWRGKTVSLPFDACAFGYRSSLFQSGRYVVLSVSLRLTPSREDLIRATMRSLTARRAASQPLDLPSAGSAFRRPVGMFAAKLIEDAGLRGYSVGGAQVSDKHCGFLVNTGNATAYEVRQLVTLVQDRVLQQSGVYLIPEIVME